ncbi:phosphatase phospho-type [Hyaloraphidium curvatum]|nr:phosphatase phospho-type [Hyaloraphidium curvatum]
MESLWQEHGKALPDAFHGSLLDIPMHEGTVSLLQTVRSKFCDNAKMVILSDANTTEIRSVLRHKGLEEHFHDIVAHESGFREDGKLFAVSRGRDRRHTCEVRDTHLGMCKGIELREYLKSLENEHKPHIVVYCGDGFNDVCGVLGALGESDYVLALRGAALHTSLEQMKAEKPESVKPTVLAWTDGAELEKLALDILRHHTQSD